MYEAARHAEIVWQKITNYSKSKGTNNHELGVSCGSTRSAVCLRTDL